MFTDFSVMAMIFMCPQWFVSSIERHSFPVPDAPKTREVLVAQYAVVARVFTLACADEHLLTNLESLVAVQ